MIIFYYGDGVYRFIANYQRRYTYIKKKNVFKSNFYVREICDAIYMIYIVIFFLLSTVDTII